MDTSRNRAVGRWSVMTAAVAVLLTAAGAVRAEAGVYWSTNERAAAQQAQRSGAPLMVWLGYHRSGCCDEDDALDRMEDAQRRAFNDATVTNAARNFVTLRADLGDRDSQFRRFGAAFELAFVSPSGTRLGGLASRDVQDPKRVLAAMRAALEEYRRQTYEKDVKPMLASESAAPAAVKSALRGLRKTPVRGADKDVLALLKRRDIGKDVEGEALAALGVLSGPAAVKELIKRAPDDERAANALASCDAEALEPLLSHLDNRNKAEFLIVYRAITRACQISSPKPDKFWDGPNERVKKNEIDRVKGAARDAAVKWRDAHADDR